ncbi:MAG: hypothetical protein ACRBCI_15125 [Cellvibrionaceae bacterium]
MKAVIFIFLALFISINVTAESFPDDLYAMPIAEGLPEHEWSYQQGLDFDVIHFRNTQGNGVRIYLDVKAKPVNSNEYIDTTVMGQPVKLFKKCTKKNDCMYTASVNSGIQLNGTDLWTQIWVKPENNNIQPYVNWLSTLSFQQKKS